MEKLASLHTLSAWGGEVIVLFFRTKVFAFL
jgi:hypothetical protein